MMRKKLFALTLAAATAVSFMGCGNSNNSNGQQNTTAQVQKPAAESAQPAGGGEEKAGNTDTETPAEEKAEKRTFGCVVFSSTAQSSQREASAFTEYVEARGDEAIVLYAEGDLQKMLDSVDDLISREVDGIIMQMVTSEPPVTMFEELKNAGIPLALIDGAATNTTEEDGYVLSEVISYNYGAGVQAAEDLYARSNGETINCLVMERPDSESGQDRCDGFMETIEKYDNLVLLEHNSTVTDNAEQELELASSWIQKYDDIGAIFSFHDVGAMACVQALKAEGRLEGVYVYGVDGNSDAMESIQGGELTGTVLQQQRAMATEAITDIYNYLDGKELGHEYHRELDTVLITEDNIEEYINY